MNEHTGIWDPRDYPEWMRRVARSNLPPMIISVAITGGVAGKEINPNLPETPQEQAQQTYDAYNAGASLVHVHSRQRKNPALTSIDSEEYREVNKLIRDKCPDIIINNTTGGGLGAEEPEHQLVATEANPEVASLDCGPLTGRHTLKKRPECGRDEEIEFEFVSRISFSHTEKFAKAMLDKGILPEIEVWHTGQWWLVQNLIDKGLVKPPYLIQLVMGFSSGAYPTPKEVINLVETAPMPSNLFVIGVGPWQASVITMGILLGINVRTGLEDNTHLAKGRLAENNAELVEKVVRMAKELGREIATPKQARQMLGLSETPTQY